MDTVQLDPATCTLQSESEQGKVLGRPGCPADTISLLRRKATESDDYRTYHELGMALAELNRQEEAIGAFMKALDLKPDFDEACNKIGSAFASRGLLQPAAHWFARARQINPATTKYLYPYGRVLVLLDSREQAAEVLNQWIEAEPDNPIARHLASAALGAPSIAKASEEYVRGLFDSCASRFDENLANLKYCGPELVLRALRCVSDPPITSCDILDVGCGTGLAGLILKPFARRLVGVDLSIGMLDVARQRTIYDELIQSDLVDYLGRHTREFDILVAVDVLTYIGDLTGFFSMAARALRPGGQVVVVTEALRTNDDYRLNPTGRFSHSRDYLQQVMYNSAFRIAYFEEDAMRYEAKTPVASWVALGIADGEGASQR